MDFTVHYTFSFHQIQLGTETKEVGNKERSRQRLQENDERFTLKILKIYENGILFFSLNPLKVLVKKNKNLY